MKAMLSAALIVVGSVPYALAASLLAGDSLGGVLLWMAIGVAYTYCLVEAADRLMKKTVR